MERSEQKRIVEALVLAATEPISARRLADIVPDCSAALARELIEELNADYAVQGRAFAIREMAGGHQARTCDELAPYLRELAPMRALRLSRAALETLAVVAYRQPVTRAEVEHVRGVDAGVVLRNLLERQLVRIAGHREVPGRPLLYATTRRFLEVLGLRSLQDLPTLRDLEELSPESLPPALVPPEESTPAEEALAAEDPAFVAHAESEEWAEDPFDDDDDEPSGRTH
jgi:segregation and condensation protein B